jgi:hypothetical protein
MRNNTFLLPPTFLIIGAQKAGTTALSLYLAQHPQVIPASIKEIDFFGCETRFEKGVDFYHSHFIFPQRSESFFQDYVTFEGSPHYLLNEFAAKRIHSYNSSIKIIAILRNPVDRAFSAWNMYCNYYQNDPNWFHIWMKRCDATYSPKEIVQRSIDSFVVFEKAIDQEIETIIKGRDIEASILKHGFYYEQLQRYFSYFNKDQLLIIHSYDLKINTVNILKDIEYFLGIENYDWNKADISIKFKGTYFTEMSTEIRERLHSFYNDDIEKLYELLDVNYLW